MGITFILAAASLWLSVARPDSGGVQALAVACAVAVAVIAALWLYGHILNEPPPHVG